MDANELYYGDNLDILPRYVGDESVDLIYLDPPFKSNQDYNVLFAERDGTQAAAQIKAFEDTWRWDQAAVRRVRRGGRAWRTGGRGPACVQDVRRAERHACLPVDDGASPRRAATGAEADRKPLPALRPDVEPLPEAAARRGLRT